MASSSNLEIYLDNVTPENIISKESINTLMELYTDSFDDLQNLLETPIRFLDTDFLIEELERTGNLKLDDIRKELFKIHLEEIYTTFAEVEDSEEIYTKFKGIYDSLNIPTIDLKVEANIDESINSQYINAATSYKTKKGTASGFFYVYDIINRANIQNINPDKFFNLIEGTEADPLAPYAYTVETSLYKEVFERTVIPLSHPVGFDWTFIRLVFLTLEDYFGLEETETLDKLTMQCTIFNVGVTTENLLKAKVDGETPYFGNLRSFETSIDEDKQQKIVVDFEPTDDGDLNGIRVIREYNGRIYIMDRADSRPVSAYSGIEIDHPLYDDRYDPMYNNQTKYLEIEEVRLVDKQNGNLRVNYITRSLMGEEFQVVESIEFDEYSIINRALVTLEFKIRNGLDKWYTSRLYFDDKEISDDKKFFKTEFFNRQEIIASTLSCDGEILVDKGDECSLTYNITYSYKVKTTDITPYVENTRPNNLFRERDTSDIIIDPEVFTADILAGRDPYADTYSNHDHTVEETNTYDTTDWWARLAVAFYSTPLTIGQTGLDPITNIGHLAPQKIVDPDTGAITYLQDGEITDFVIGSSYRLTPEGIHPFDRNIDKSVEPIIRYHITRPDAKEDLELLGYVDPSQARIDRYKAENQWIDIAEDPDKVFYRFGNSQYTAWEDYGMNIVFTPEVDDYETDLIIENFVFNSFSDLEDNVLTEKEDTDDDYTPEKYLNGLEDEIASFIKPTISVKYGEQLLWDIEPTGEILGVTEYRIGGVLPVEEDEDAWDFGVYRFNETSLEWDIVADNNVSAYAAP